jgi:hypothetical protein
VKLTVLIVFVEILENGQIAFAPHRKIFEAPNLPLSNFWFILKLHNETVSTVEDVLRIS